jgi:hypothetical protein
MNNEQEHEKTIEDREYIDAETFVEMYDEQALQELVTDGICPDCGEEVDLSKGDHTIMIKAECPGEECSFGFVDTVKNVEKFSA